MDFRLIELFGFFLKHTIKQNIKCLLTYSLKIANITLSRDPEFNDNMICYYSGLVVVNDGVITLGKSVGL